MDIQTGGQTDRICRSDPYVSSYTCKCHKSYKKPQIKSKDCSIWTVWNMRNDYTHHERLKFIHFLLISCNIILTLYQFLTGVYYTGFLMHLHLSHTNSVNFWCHMWQTQKYVKKQWSLLLKFSDLFLFVLFFVCLFLCFFRLICCNKIQYLYLWKIWGWDKLAKCEMTKQSF